MRKHGYPDPAVELARDLAAVLAGKVVNDERKLDLVKSPIPAVLTKSRSARA